MEKRAKIVAVGVVQCLTTLHPLGGSPLLVAGLEERPLVQAWDTRQSFERTAIEWSLREQDHPEHPIHEEDLDGRGIGALHGAKDGRLWASVRDQLYELDPRQPQAVNNVLSLP